MFRLAQGIGGWFAIAAAIGLLCAVDMSAAKPPTPPPSVPAYTIVPFLPPQFASVYSQVTDLNETGQAVGYAELDGTPAEYRAVHLEIATGVYTVLQGGSHAGGVNNLNQIAGRVCQEDGSDAPAFWNGPSAAPFELPLLPGHTQGWAEAINDAGIIVGVSKDENSDGGGVVWRVFVDEAGAVSADGPVTLPPLAGDWDAGAVDVNELVGGSFQVAGSSRSTPQYPVFTACRWTLSVRADGTLAPPVAPVSLGTLGLNDPSQSYSLSAGMNDLGDVCGLSDEMPFVAPAGQTAQPLPVPRGTVSGRAHAINNLGEIAGQVEIVPRKNYAGFYPYAYLWKDGAMVNLEQLVDPDSGWDRLWGAYLINDAGLIAGRGRYDVDSRGFLLIPNAR
jgi:uncharacterized membrane protein